MPSFTEYIYNRLHRENRNFLAAIVGPTGSGKSYSALRLAETIDPNFSIERVVFTPEEFMDLLNSKTLKKGSAIVFDEGGVGMNSRNFMSNTNRALHYTAQTFRSMNYLVCFVAPDYSFMDVGLRKLAHVLIETISIDYERERVRTRPLMIQNNPQSGKIYLKYPRVRDSNNRILAITKLWFSKPSPELLKEYEREEGGLQSNPAIRPVPIPQAQRTRTEAKAPQSMGASGAQGNCTQGFG